VTEETQRGFLPGLLRGRMRPRMLSAHQSWIDQLARLAETGEKPR
jgi:hypothetical protein